ncbi:ATP-dependent helicase [Jonesia quinghaiensis]|uniref:ATP-dependent helicase n=1 Tax=Jonesia quinghaiensis TaxID=262806 RepID=UPI0005664868|nr:ATP-dependent DNA helicase UvrD2 [Jonesia quinghaiensis]
MSSDPQEILDALDPDQREVAMALTGPVCVLAGAGTGKTRAITHRIAYGVRTGMYVPTSVLAVTFTARAAGEMRVRLRDLGVQGVQARTFHAAALKQLGYFWPKVVGGPPPQIVEYKARIVAQAATRLGLEADRVTVRDLASEVEWSKVSMVSAADYEKAATAIGRPAPAGFDHKTIARLLDSYEEVKELGGVIDFEDVLLLLGGILQDRTDVARQVRDQYRRFVVDEYQDVSPLQQFVLDQWLGDRRELCVVGDPSQTIYSFTGATPHHLLSFGQRYRDATTIRLIRDYRSTPQIVTMANRLLTTASDKHRFPVLDLQSQRESGAEVSCVVFADDAREAAGISERIARVIAQGVAPRDIAVLYRTNSQSQAFEEALAAVGVSFQVRGGERFFSRKDVRSALLMLKGAARSAPDDVSPAQAIEDVLRTAGWSSTAPQARGAARERWEALNAVWELTQSLGEQGLGLTEIVGELDERARHQHAPTVDSVTLASLHAAKGLEWSHVYLAGLSEGLMPISLAQTPEAVAEERRLLYVGITRAQHQLTLSYSQSRSGTGRTARQVSRFLAPLWTGPRDTSQKPQRGVSDQRVPRPRRGEMHGELFVELRSWRSQWAAQHDVEDHMVVPTTVLRALATQRPATWEAFVSTRGVGQERAVAWGEEAFDIIRKYGPS